MPPRRQQQHQNTVAWIPARADKHNSLRGIVAALPNDGVCRRCHDQIEWKKSYGKYKPLKVPAKCTGCRLPTVQLAYHMLCQGCAGARDVCAKCGVESPMQEKDPNEDVVAMPTTEELATMTERQRRSALRKVEKAKEAKKAAAKALLAPADGTVDGGYDRSPAAISTAFSTATAAQPAAPPSTRPLPVPPPPPQPPAPTAAIRSLAAAAPNAESVYATLASKGCVPSVCGAAGAAEEATWSDRDQEGRTDDDDDDGSGGSGALGLKGSGSVSGGGLSGSVSGGGLGLKGSGKSSAGRRLSASRLNLDDDAAVDAVEAEAVTDDDEDDGEEGEEGEEEDVDEDDDDDEDEDEEVLMEHLASLAHSPGGAHSSPLPTATLESLARRLQRPSSPPCLSPTPSIT